MSTSAVDEWKTVTKSDKKRFARRGNNKKKNGKEEETREAWHLHANSNDSDGCTLSQNGLERVTSQCQLELESTKFMSQLQDILVQRPPPTSLVCYGIGNFGRKQSTPSASMWQLACVLQLRTFLKEQGNDIPMYYFEPTMTTDEALFLKQLSVYVITENEKGRRIAKEPTLFFMPHCPLALYSNLLFANRKTLKNVMIFGNSLAAYAHRLERNCHTMLLQQVEPFWDECCIELSREDISSFQGHFEQGFNDSAIIYFKDVTDLILPKVLSEELLCEQDESGEVI